jgi:hypothetical protein
VLALDKLDVPALRAQPGCVAAADAPWALSTDRGDAIDAAASVLPRPAALLGDSDRLLLGGHFHWVGAGRPGVEGGRRDLPDVHAGRLRVLGPRGPYHPLGAEVVEQLEHDRRRDGRDRTLGAELAKDALCHAVVVRDRAALEALVALLGGEHAFVRRS